MNSHTLKENDMNEMILNLMDKKKKGTVGKKKKMKKSIQKECINKKDIKSTVENVFKQQEKIYRDEEENVLQYIKNETSSKEKELNEYYTYCQKFKNEYKKNFNEALKHSEEMKKELKDLHIEYLDNKLLLENKRKMELKGMFNFYKEKLLDIKTQCGNKTFCDENLKNIVYDILSVIH
ncbi:hypothetical protein, conserved [Plasmodium gonderi]|uniref:Uncharacterized protein n=1 Tax=Plasmodium gonderi TaxID=77519 RepID=A0A1Y1JGS7_PLAGO|nr:hypothetical protein, conserved [Plasmodium gonderi]GAW79962.1 hypothetical protein, conserved [Plasmodium gonderi]